MANGKPVLSNYETYKCNSATAGRRRWCAPVSAGRLLLVALALVVEPAARCLAQVAAPDFLLATNHVLQLDGTNSCVELPASAFTNLTVATIEGWIKWESFNSGSRYFDFAVGGQTFNLQNRFRSPDLWLERDRVDGPDFVQWPGVLSSGSWSHIAAVVGPETLKLYFNGVQVTNEVVRGSDSTAGVEKRNYLGRSNWRTISGVADEDFRGQMGEVRVWRGERTEAQIREATWRKLTGLAPGLKIFHLGLDSGFSPVYFPGR
jgi:hypothetical protein